MHLGFRDRLGHIIVEHASPNTSRLFTISEYFWEVLLDFCERLGSIVFLGTLSYFLLELKILLDEFPVLFIELEFFGRGDDSPIF